MDLKGVDFAREFREAIIHYPELAKSRIVFKRKKIGTIMAARPTIWSVFKPASKRKYFILINRQFRNSEYLFSKLDYNARVGIIGHELAHIVDYNCMNSFQLLQYGINYLINRRKIEHRTDESTVFHGLGIELYQYALKVFDPDVVGRAYFRYKLRNYLSPVRILNLSISHLNQRK
jgi:hypothetical protein